MDHLVKSYNDNSTTTRNRSGNVSGKYQPKAKNRATREKV